MGAVGHPFRGRDLEEMMYSTDYRHIVEKVRERTDIVQVIGKRVSLNSRHKGLCPFHKEKTASFSVNPRDQYFHCFGCNVGGDVFRFLELLEGNPFMAVLKELAEEVGIRLETLTDEQLRQIEEGRRIQSVLDETAEFYTRDIPPEVKRYLTEERGLTQESITHFKVGYANGGLRGYLVGEKRFSEDTCIKAGVLRKTGHGKSRNFFYRRITFPTLVRGHVGHISARSPDGREPKYLHLPGEIDHLYNEDDLSSKDVICTEGIIPCIRAVQAGFPCVGVHGASGFKTKFVGKFSRCERINVCMDGDEAGIKGALKTGDLIGERARIVKLPLGLDPDEYLDRHRPDELAELIKSAPTRISYEIYRIPSDTPKLDLRRLIEPVLTKLSSLDEASIEAYLTDVLKPHFKLTRDEVNAYRKSLKKHRKVLQTRVHGQRLNEPICNTESDNTTPYKICNGRICVERMTREGLVTFPLCNFVAQVTEDRTHDNGMETARLYKVSGKLASGETLPSIAVPVNQFGTMNWVPEFWGFKAVVRAGMSTRDQLREAIQVLSPSPVHRKVFTHTGWHKHADEWVYLTANGAVGHNGLEVDLDSALSRYELPCSAENPIEAMRASLRLLEVGPRNVTVPLLAAMYRAPLAAVFPIDFMLWLEGFSGSLKSTLAALFLSHFGRFGRTTLPCGWISTANALEQCAFTVKDAPLVIDDYAPSGRDNREFEAKAARLIRSQGNIQGRTRLRADLTQRPTHPPRGLIISTAEQHPPGLSRLARLLIVEVQRQNVNLELLSKTQREASILRHAMSAYVAWLAPQMATISDLLSETFSAARERATTADQHLRVPESIANLWLGVYIATEFAKEIGACTAKEVGMLRTNSFDALRELGRDQNRAVEDERPTRRFLGVLHTLLTQKRIVVLPKNEPEDIPSGETPLVGWYDTDLLYLMPDAVYQGVARFCRDAGEEFPIRKDRLMRDLAQEKLTLADTGRHTTTIRIGDKTRRVLSLRRGAAERLLGEQLPLPLTGVTGITVYEEN